VVLPVALTSPCPFPLPTPFIWTLWYVQTLNHKLLCDLDTFSECSPHLSLSPETGIPATFSDKAFLHLAALKPKDQRWGPHWWLRSHQEVEWGSPDFPRKLPDHGSSSLLENTSPLRPCSQLPTDLLDTPSPKFTEHRGMCLIALP
jgi:hypothetical protein